MFGTKVKLLNSTEISANTETAMLSSPIFQKLPLCPYRSGTPAGQRVFPQAGAPVLSNLFDLIVCFRFYSNLI